MLEGQIDRIVRRVINEELTKSDVNGVFDDRLKGRDFEKRVQDIVDDAMERMFKNMWQRKNWWKG